MTVGATRKIAERVSGLRYDDLPTLAVERAKVAILDTIGVMLGGIKLEPAQMITAYVDGIGASGQATVFGTGLRTSPEHAALANGVLAHVLDFDDRWHASTHTLPAAISIAELNDRSGRDLITSYVVGRELRLHLDLEFRPGRGGGNEAVKGAGPGWRGWHETGVMGSLGAVAAAAHGLRLDTDRTQMAIGIAASLASGVMANFGTSTKSLHAGNAARNGVLAATLAQAGFTSDPRSLEARRGLVEALTYPEERDMDKVADGFSSFFHIVEHGIRIKPYPACTGVHQYVEMARGLVAAGVRPDDVVEMKVSRIDGATTKRDFPTTDLECKFSPAFVAAATLFDGRLTLANCNYEFAQRPDVAGLLAKARYEDSPKGFVSVTTVDGRVLREEPPVTAFAEGSPAMDLEDDAEIISKFHDCADPIVGEANARAIRSIVGGLEELDSVRELTALVAP